MEKKQATLTTQLYDSLPKLRLFLYVDRIPSVNELYDYFGGRVVKSSKVRSFQEEIGNQILTVDLTKYPWINDHNYYATDYKFVLRNSFNSRDTTNMIKATEDAIHSALGTNDNRVIPTKSQKYHNPEMVRELIIFTIYPYTGPLSIREAFNTSDLGNGMLESAVNMSKRYADQILKVKELFKIDVDTKHCKPINLGYIAKDEIIKIVDPEELTPFLRTLKYLNMNLIVVFPKRNREYIKMVSPEGTICEMSDEEIQDRVDEGYHFSNYNYMITGD